MFAGFLEVDDSFDAESFKLADHVVFEDVDGVGTCDRHHLIWKPQGGF